MVRNWGDNPPKIMITSLTQSSTHRVASSIIQEIEYHPVAYNSLGFYYQTLVLSATSLSTMIQPNDGSHCDPHSSSNT